jgi:hypothetical protein
MARLIFKVENGERILFDIVADAPDAYSPVKGIDYDQGLDQWFRYYEGGACKSFASIGDAMKESDPIHTYVPIEAKNA